MFLTRNGMIGSGKYRNQVSGVFNFGFVSIMYGRCAECGAGW